MQKKKIVALGIVLIIIIFIMIIINLMPSETVTKEEQKFKEEYETLNGKNTANGDKKYMTIEIEKDNGASYVSLEEVLEILENGTGVIYFGFPECPWCRNLVPVLIEALQETENKGFYYCNALNERDQKHLDENGNIITDQEGSENYYKLIELLKDYLGNYEGLNNDSIKRLYFPTVIFVKEGKIVGIHIGTIDTQIDPYIKLTNEQKNELKSELITKIREVQRNICTEDTKC